MFLLVDCNNFFVSCERLFRPDLQDKPVAVLSNNDGCIVARSQEVKELGIPMGAPVFKFRDILKRHHVTTFSSNFTLYADMSRRVMAALQTIHNTIEVYSIDEAFIKLESLRSSDIIDLGRKIQQTVLQWTGIPVSVGCAPSKTLAKAANELAKKNIETGGVLLLNGSTTDDAWLSRLPVGDVWGIGRQYVRYAHGCGIRSAADLKYAKVATLSPYFGIHAHRLLHELNGRSINSSQHTRSSVHQTIITSRTFPRSVSDKRELEQASAAFIQRAAEKLRADEACACCVHVWLKTNRFSSERYESQTIAVPLLYPTDYSGDLIAAAHNGLERIFLHGRGYKRLGVMLSGIVPRQGSQASLFEKIIDSEKRHQLMHACDMLNRKFGRGTIKNAAEGIQQQWQQQRQFTSRVDTTARQDMPIVHAI